jgi:DNA helicase HerA-like ATPase
MSLDRPEEAEKGEYARWERRLAAYRTVLHKAGFRAPDNYTVKFAANANVRTAVAQAAGRALKDPSAGLTLKEAQEWFEAARAANQATPLPGSSPGSRWIDDTLQALLDMIVQKGRTDNFISGFRILAEIVKYHSPNRTDDVADEIYSLLAEGKIVILDLSVGDPTLRDKISKQIAQKIFNRSMGVFLEGKFPPNIVVYIEEAHNLIGKDLDLIDTWPRLAKEGAKYRIALVYATQEVSSVHPNILANTENWFISHLNNEREIRELARFYDFGDFGESLMRAQDVGFARVKTLSSPYVIPIQIDKFDPDTQKARLGSGNNK